MARKSRYRKYAEGIQRVQSNRPSSTKASTAESVLQKLKKLKGQEFIMNVPMGGVDGK